MCVYGGEGQPSSVLMCVYVCGGKGEPGSICLVSDPGSTLWKTLLLNVSPLLSDRATSFCGCAEE